MPAAAAEDKSQGEQEIFGSSWMFLMLELPSLSTGVWMQEGSQGRIHPGGELDRFLA